MSRGPDESTTLSAAGYYPRRISACSCLVNGSDPTKVPLVSSSTPLAPEFGALMPGKCSRSIQLLTAASLPKHISSFGAENGGMQDEQFLLAALGMRPYVVGFHVHV